MENFNSRKTKLWLYLLRYRNASAVHPTTHAQVLQFNMTDRLTELLNMSWHKVCCNQLQKSLWQTTWCLEPTVANATQPGGSYSE